MPLHLLAVAHIYNQGNERHEELEERVRYLAIRQNRFHVPHVRVTMGIRCCARPNFLGAINLTQAIEDGMKVVVLSDRVVSPLAVGRFLFWLPAVVFTIIWPGTKSTRRLHSW